MVNVQKYQIVAIGDTVSECESVYTDLMYENGIKEEEEDVREVQTITAPITKNCSGSSGRKLTLLYYGGRI